MTKQCEQCYNNGSECDYEKGNGCWRFSYEEIMKLINKES